MQTTVVSHIKKLYVNIQNSLGLICPSILHVIGFLSLKTIYQKILKKVFQILHENKKVISASKTLLKQTETLVFPTA